MADACRLFPWTDEQRTLAKELWDSIEMPYIDDGTRMDTLLKLIKSFIFATVRGDVFSSGLLHFMAVLCIDEEMGRLRDANRFHSYLQVLFIARESLQSRQYFRQQNGTVRGEG
ncbi:unnamed protein product [Aureobasidium pullulans]|nr:unnamed protein product [Aureobasidium pullulans]